jgi:DNA integrity scanning protein DisA with diadenylate cyclase activity
VHPSGKEVKVIIATSNQQCYEKIKECPNVKPLKVTMWPKGRVSQANHAMACGLREGHLRKGENLICLVGDGFADMTDAVMILPVTGEEHVSDMLESDRVLSSIVELSIELACGGADGKPIGAAFIIGESKEILRLSHQLLINPFDNYSANIADRKQWELLKKYASFDGAFIIDNDGKIVAAHRYLDAQRKVDIPKGLGTRHHAVAAMTAATGSKGITVSGEDGWVRVFKCGEMVVKINTNSRIIECLHESV